MRPLLLLLLLCLSAARALPSGGPFLGDYDSEPRTPDGHVDSPLLVQRLQDLGANTYMWLIWHAPTDWEDLQTFLPLAEKANISVWVYLAPHSESGPEYPYSEPFRLDYVRWAQEIARLSLRHRNLVGYVIDDFRANMSPDRFSLRYIREMTAAGKAINPHLRFYPLLYYPEINPALAHDLAPLVDGVVAAYPRSRREIEQAVRVLNDEVRTPAGATIVFPWDQPSQAGDHGLISQTVKVRDPAHAGLSFTCWDDFSGPTAGYHFLQVRVDDQVVCERDCASPGRGTAHVDLREAVAGKADVKLNFGVFDKQGVSNFGLAATFGKPEFAGLEVTNPGFADARGWATEVAGAFSVRFAPALGGERRFRLPLIVMPSGSRSEHQDRYGEEGTAERITAKVRMSVELLREGRLEGVVTYCLDKEPGSEDLKALAAVYRDYWEAHPRL